MSLRLTGGASAVAALVALVAVLGPPTTATADTARLVLAAPPADYGPARAAIVITGTDGSARTLGPFDFPGVPYGLRRSPDGRHFAVPWGRWSGNDRGLAIVPTDGSDPFVVLPRRTGGRSYYAYPEDISWTSDSRFVVFGNADDDDGDVSDDVVRCSVSRRSCRVMTGVDGYVATVPGGIVTSSTRPYEAAGWTEFVPGSEIYAYPDPATRSELRTRWRSRTVLVTTKRRVLRERRTTVFDGVDNAEAIAGGPSGALIVQARYRLRPVQRRQGPTARFVGAPIRWTIVRPNGVVRTVRPPVLRVPRTDGALTQDDDSTVMRVRAQRAFPEARTPIEDGGWLGVTGWLPGIPGTPSTTSGRGGLVLTTITPAGRAAFVWSRGQLVSATWLVRSVVARTPRPGTSDLDVVGHEPATRTAIVVLSWLERTPPPADDPSAIVPGAGGLFIPADKDRRYHATVRVPLDGRTAPTVVNREQEQAAW